LPELPKITEIEMLATQQVFGLDFLAISAILAISRDRSCLIKIYLPLV
jgi:hypothetical protein